jgi:hypothetical protein
MHQQQRNRRWRDATDARGLADRRRQRAFKFEQHFGGQSAHLVVVEAGGNRGVLVAALTLDFLALALEVAGILDLHFDLRGDILAFHCGTELGNRGELCVVEFRSAQQIQRAGFSADGDAELALDCCTQRIVGGRP